MVHASETSHYWYAIVADCSLEEYDAHPPTLHYKIRFRNGGSELPADEDGLLVLNVLVLLVLLGSLLFVVRGVQASLTEHKQVHLVVLLLAAAQVLQTISGGHASRNIYRHCTVLSCLHRHSAVLSCLHRHSAVLSCLHRHCTVLSCLHRHSTELLWRQLCGC